MTDISHTSDKATQQTNVTDQGTPILVVSPIEGKMLVIEGSVGKGKESGIPIYADLRDSNDDPLPLDTKMQLTYEMPTDDKPRVVSEPLLNIRPYRTHPISDQDSEDRIDQFKHELHGRALIVRHTDTFAVEIDSSAQIDWSNSELYFDPKAVREEAA
jgi:hypothetical protein